MCSSKPKIPNSKTPPAPLAPEASPDAPLIGGERRGYYRSRGLTIPPKPDLSGLGNQEMGTPVQTLLIRPGESRAVTPLQIRQEQQAVASERASAAAAAARRRRAGYRR